MNSTQKLSAGECQTVKKRPCARITVAGTKAACAGETHNTQAML